MSTRKALISQEAFDAAVLENVEDFGMDQEEAVADAIHTFQLQGADLSGIVTGARGRAVIDAIRELESGLDENAGDGIAVDRLCIALDKLRIASSGENASIAVRNGAVKAAVMACKRLIEQNHDAVLAMKTIIPLLDDEQSKKDFYHSGGCEMITNSLSRSDNSSDFSKLAAAVIASAASGSEVLKEEFMHLKADATLTSMLRNNSARNAQVASSACDALKALVSADDNNVLASNTFKHARTIWKAGAVNAVLETAFTNQKDPTLLASLCATLKAMAVSEEICKSISDAGGLELALQFVEESFKMSNKSLARNSCALITQLALSDANKDAIASQGGCAKLVTLALCYAEDVSVIQEVMSALASITLRSPSNATKAAEAGAIDLAVEMMDKHPQAAGMQKQTCHMLRNLASRNPENRALILERGLEKLIRAAKSRHASCKDASSAALRDLGLDNYN